MKQKARLKAIQKATNSKAGNGQPVTEIIIYGTDENGESRLLETIQTEPKIYLPDNGRGDVQKARRP